MFEMATAVIKGIVVILSSLSSFAVRKGPSENAPCYIFELPSALLLLPSND